MCCRSEKHRLTPERTEDLLGRAIGNRQRQKCVAEKSCGLTHTLLEVRCVTMKMGWRAGPEVGRFGLLVAGDGDTKESFVPANWATDRAPERTAPAAETVKQQMIALMP